MRFNIGQLIVFRTIIPTFNQFINMERSSRYIGAKKKKVTEQQLVLEMRAQKIKSVGDKDYPLNFEYDWYCKDKRTDKSNLIATSVKMVEDAMQKAGIIRNDGWKEVGKIYVDFHVDKDDPRLEVFIS
tara:strand:+ start:1462 stop:1845 length:384 start_codon:yes stop_codon:yes gene_type:complete